MLRLWVLQTRYILVDDQAQSPLRDRLSFRRLVDLALGDLVLDAKTLWRWREQLTKPGEQVATELLGRPSAERATSPSTAPTASCAARR